MGSAVLRTAYQTRLLQVQGVTLASSLSQTFLIMLRAFGFCCSGVSGFGVLMLCVVAACLNSGTNLLGEVDDKPGAATRCYYAAAVYAVFFVLSLLTIRFAKDGGDSGRKLVF